MSKFISIVLLCFVGQILLSQDLTDQQKIYQSFSLQYNVNKNSSISGSYTGIGELNNFEFTYHDFGFNFTRNISQNSDLSIGVDLIKINQRNTNSFANYFRTNLEYTRQYRIKKFTLSSELNSEVYFPKFNKFQYRIIYSLGATYRLNITKWKIRPYTKFKLYYYGGGKYLDYYDEESDLIAKKSPNDIHRWRWYLGVKMKPHKQLSVVISYFWNEEFNAGIFENSDINIYNKNKDGVKYAFNSYGALNLSFTYNIKIKKKKSDNKEVESDFNKEN